MTLPGMEPNPRPIHEYEVTLWWRRPRLTQAERDELDPIARVLSFRWQEGTRGVALTTEVCAPGRSNAVRQAADRLRQVVAAAGGQMVASLHATGPASWSLR